MDVPLIVGDLEDLHVSSVVACMRSKPIVIDGPALARSGFSLTLDRVRHEGREAQLDSGRGWLRRYAPTEWGIGSVAGSLDAAVRRSFLSLIGSVSRLGGRDWLTPLSALLHAEDRMVQLEAARVLQLPAPESLITSDGSEAADCLGEFVVKPLAGGFYVDEDNRARAVFTSVVDPDEIDGLNFAQAPFLAQRVVAASGHLRVVTVGATARTAYLDAAGRPLDWRAQPEAHESWTAAAEPEVERWALLLVRHLGLGYSSQDWIIGPDGPMFVDLNPAGQWLFLPEPMASAVTEDIAAYLDGQ